MFQLWDYCWGIASSGSGVPDVQEGTGRRAGTDEAGSTSPVSAPEVDPHFYLSCLRALMGDDGKGKFS